MNDPWRAQRTEDGSWTLLQAELDEACHSRSGAWTEARERYAGACRLAQRGQRGGTLRLLDVGTGLGWNVAAAFEALAESGTRLAVTSLERDPRVLSATLDLAYDADGPGEAFHAPVRTALARALAAPARPVPVACPGGAGELTLVLEDAVSALAMLEPELAFDAVFLDLFSPAAEPDVWAPALFEALARRMAPGSWLSTYSAAGAVRLGLARAGLRVGRGPRVGAKAEGTLASPDQDPPPLSPQAERRLLRALGPGFLATPARESPPSFD